MCFDRIIRAGFSILSEGDTAEIRSSLGGFIGIVREGNKFYELVSHVSKNVVCSVVDVLSNVTAIDGAEKLH